LLLYGLLAGTPLVPPGFKYAFAGAAILGLCLVRIPDLARGRFRGLGGWADAFLLGFLVWCLASSLFVSDLPGRSIGPFLLLCAHVALLYVVLNSFGREAGIAFVPISAGVTAALVGVLQYYEVGPLHRSAMFGSRITSTFANPNHLSSYLGVCFLMLLGASFSEGRARLRLAMYSGMLLIYTAMLMAGTRGAIVSVVAGGALILPALPRSEALRRWKEVLGLLCAMAAVTVLYSLPSPLNRGSEASERIASSVEILRAPEARDAHILHRWLIWSVTARIVRAHPLVGVGYGTFAHEYAPAEEGFLSEPGNARRFRFPVRPPPASYAHNEYLHISAETGLVGLALFLAFLSAAGAKAVRSFRLSEQRERPLWLGAAGGLASVLVHGLVSYPLHMPATSVLFWALLGWLLAPLGPISHAPHLPRPPWPPRPRSRTLCGSWGKLKHR